MVSFVTDWQARRCPVRIGFARQDMVWQAKRARVGIGSARNVTERHGRQGMSRPGGEGWAFFGKDRQERRGMKRIGKQVRGVAWQARYGLKKRR